MAETRIKPWRVTASAIAFQDRWLTVRSDTCVTSSGAKIAPWHVLDCPDWVNVVALDDLGQVVLVRQYRHGRGEVMLGLPSGTSELSDGADATARSHAAAGRELTEETGYRAARLVPVLSSYPNAANHSNLVTTYLATQIDRSAPPADDPTEVVEVVLEDIATVMGNVTSGAWRLQSMHVAALWSAIGWVLANPAATGVTSAQRQRIMATIGAAG